MAFRQISLFLHGGSSGPANPGTAKELQKLGIEAMATDAWLARTTLTPSWSWMRPGSCPFTISHVSGAIACKSRASILQQDRRRQVPPRTPCCAANDSPSAEPLTPAQLLRFMFNFTF